jgi:uncharacterized protein
VIKIESDIRLYRKRYIPNETIYLKDDEILLHQDDLIITKWKALKKRQDIDRGISAYFIDKGFKVSKIYNANNEIVYWYCDIIETQFDATTNSFVFNDLLIDILVYKDGFVKVVDLDEVAIMLLSSDMDVKLISTSLQITNSLLKIIYNGNFGTLQDIINAVE